MIIKTKTLIEKNSTIRETADKDASIVNKSINDYLSTQNQRLIEQINSNAAKAEIIDRKEKLRIMNSILDLQNEIRILNFKYQSLNDSLYLEGISTNFELINKNIDSLIEDSIVQTNINQLKAIQEAASDYKKSIDNIVSNKMNLMIKYTSYQYWQ